MDTSNQFHLIRGVVTLLLIVTGSLILYVLYIFDTDPQGYEDLIVTTLGAEGDPIYSPELKTWKVERPDGALVEIESVTKPFYIDWWNGREVLFYTPQDVWSASLLAYAKHPQCDPRYLVSLAHSESTVYNNKTCSQVGACGVFQFMPGTWNGLWPEKNRPDRHNINAAADAACRYTIGNGMVEALGVGRESFIYQFATDPPVWNRHLDQADYVWRATQINRELTPSIELPHGSPLPPLTASDSWWKQPIIALLKHQEINMWPDSLNYDPLEPPAFPPAEGDEKLALPYKKGTYTITVGLHGMDYGDCALDLAGGKGTMVYSPINGKVVQKYIDQYKNPTLVIRNSVYYVRLLHGDWTKVELGDTVKIGQHIGFESNQGYTWTWGPRYCGTGSSCGYHTHFSVHKNGVCTDPKSLINWPPERPVE